MKHFGEIAFTSAVKAEQERHGSRDLYDNMLSGIAPEALGPSEAEFIAQRNSFYMASVSETGWPYIQHRGGPTGFLKILGTQEIGFADYRGNRQYVSLGNLKGDDRVSLFLMDYPNRRRLKMLGHVRVEEASDNPELADRLASDAEGQVERLFRIQIEAFDWNCPQFITPRFTEAELQSSMKPIMDELVALRAENEQLRDLLAKKA